VEGQLLGNKTVDKEKRTVLNLKMPPSKGNSQLMGRHESPNFKCRKLGSNPKDLDKDGIEEVKDLQPPRVCPSQVQTKRCHQFSRIAARREPSFPSSLRNMIEPPGTISLYGGMPNPDTFPFVEATFKLSDGSQLEIKVKKLFPQKFKKLRNTRKT